MNVKQYQQMKEAYSFGVQFGMKLMPDVNWSRASLCQFLAGSELFSGGLPKGLGHSVQERFKQNARCFAVAVRGVFFALSKRKIQLLPY